MDSKEEFDKPNLDSELETGKQKEILSPVQSRVMVNRAGCKTRQWSRMKKNVPQLSEFGNSVSTEQIDASSKGRLLRSYKTKLQSGAQQAMGMGALEDKRRKRENTTQIAFNKPKKNRRIDQNTIPKCKNFSIVLNRLAMDANISGVTTRSGSKRQVSLSGSLQQNLGNDVDIAETKTFAVVRKVAKSATKSNRIKVKLCEKPAAPIQAQKNAENHSMSGSPTPTRIDEHIYLMSPEPIRNATQETSGSQSSAEGIGNFSTARDLAPNLTSQVHLSNCEYPISSLLECFYPEHWDEFKDELHHFLESNDSTCQVSNDDPARVFESESISANTTHSGIWPLAVQELLSSGCATLKQTTSNNMTFHSGSGEQSVVFEPTETNLHQEDSIRPSVEVTPIQINSLEEAVDSDNLMINMLIGLDEIDLLAIDLSDLDMFLGSTE